MFDWAFFQENDNAMGRNHFPKTMECEVICFAKIYPQSFIIFSLSNPVRRLSWVNIAFDSDHIYLHRLGLP